MTKKALIEGIQQINPTATTGFLMGFMEGDLQEYLARLVAVYGQQPEPAHAGQTAMVEA